MVHEAICSASPSLALIKYWGKRAGGINIPATPSLAVTLGGLVTITRVRVSEAGDRVSVNGVLQSGERFAQFFDFLRKRLAVGFRFEASSTNSFPSSAGLASSSSGFAALAIACAALSGRPVSRGVISEIARHGSASAARAVFGGYVLLPAGARSAVPIFGEDYWPNLRIVAAVASNESKPVSSRSAMESTRLTSPYYRSWVSSSARLLPEAMKALELRDLERLGEIMRVSYSRMHASLLGAAPPFLYWLPCSLTVINECSRMRAEGIGAWETMDAGPQVKILCLDKDLPKVMERLHAMNTGLELLQSLPGGPPVCNVAGEDEP
jgi:diphosphomevalonate decarboxylase